MALLFSEGFDNYTNDSDIFQSSQFGVRTTSATVSIADGHISGKAMRCNNSAIVLAAGLSQTSTATIFGGFAMRFSLTDSSSTDFLQFYDEDTSADKIAIAIEDGKIQIRRSSTVIIETPVLATNRFYFIAFKVFLSNSSGTAELWVNGSSVDSATGVDTISAGTATVNSFAFDSPGNHDFYIDHLWIGDSSGSDLTDVIPECYIEQLLPDGAGSSTQFTPLSGANYQNVDEAQMDGDTSYNSSSTATHKDLFTCSNLSSTSLTVYAVSVKNVFNKADASFTEVKSKIKSGATEGNGADRGATYSDYITNVDIFENDVNGGGDWTATNVNAIEIGYEIVT